MDVSGKTASEKQLIDANKLIDFIDVGHLRHPGELCYSEAIEALNRRIGGGKA